MRRRRGLMKQPPLVLYDGGNEYTEITGGWNEQFPIYNHSYWQGGGRKGVFDKNPSDLFLNSIIPSAGEQTTRSIACETYNKINLDTYSQLKFEISEMHLDSNIYAKADFGAISDRITEGNTTVLNGVKLQITQATTGIISVDVSALFGDYYIFAATQRQTGTVDKTASMKIAKIWLE